MYSVARSALRIRISSESAPLYEGRDTYCFEKHKYTGDETTQKAPNSNIKSFKMTTDTVSPSPSKDESILVIGAGEFGLSLALELKKRGYRSVTVLDRFLPPVPDGSSVDISRIIRSEYADPFYNALGNEAIAAWATDYGDSFHQSGFVIVAENERNTYFSGCKSVLEANGKPFDSFSDAEAPLKKLYPSIQADFSGRPALHSAQGGWADAGASIAELAKRCSLEGVAFHTGLHGTVTSLVTPETPDGLPGVQVATGEVLRASRVALATGAWTNRLIDAEHALSASGQSVAFVQLTDSEAAELKGCPVMIDIETGVFCFPPYPGTNLLKLAWHSYGVATEVKAEDDDGTTSKINARTISAPKLYQRNDNSGFIPEEADRSLRQGLRLFFPELGDRPWVKKRLCWYTDTPEGDFIADHHPRIPGLFVATGGAGQ